jgi:hypothetical protein
MAINLMKLELQIIILKTKISHIIRGLKLRHLTGRYMQLPSGQRDKHQGINLSNPAVRATAHGVMVFAFLYKSVSKSISLLASTMAKAHATAMLRQHAHTAGPLPARLWRVNIK